MAAERLNPKYVAILALVSALILVIGNLIKPDRPQADSFSPPSQTELRLLERLTQRRSLENIASYLADVAARAEPYAVWLERAERSGVLWSPRRLVSSAGTRRFPDADVAAYGGGADRGAETLLAGPHLPLAVLEIAAGPSPEPLARAPLASYLAGGWTMIVWRTAEGRLLYRQGAFLGTRKVRCGDLEARAAVLSIGLEEQMLGGGLFDLDGVLMGVAALCEGEPVALDVADVERMVEREASFEDRLLGRYGMRLEPLDEALRQYSGTEYGLAVGELRRGYSAERAGLRPGDVIIAVDGGPVTSEHDLELLTLPLAREVFELRVMRAKRAIELRLLARPRSAAAEGDHGLIWRPARPGLPIESVVEESPAAEAGLEAGDRLLWINGSAPRSSAEARRALARRGRRPLHLVFERSGRLLGTFLD